MSNPISVFKFGIRCAPIHWRASAVGSIRGVLTADEMKQAAQTTHEAKKAAKFMAECIAALSLSVIDLLCFWLEHKKWKKGKKNATKLEKLNEIQQNTKKFSNWEEMKNTYKGKVTQFVKLHGGK